MKNLTSISNDLLHTETIQAARYEKAATLILLEHLAEIDRRRLYAARGYASLWEYIHKALEYSESQAYDRVSAMRIMVRVPEVKEELRAGKLTLTTTAKLGAHARREKLQPAETVSLLHEISGKPSREVERVLVARSTEPRKPDQVRAITPERTRVTIEVDQEFLDLVQEMKNLKGNPALSLQDIFKSAMQDYVKRRLPSSNEQPLRGCAPLAGSQARSRKLANPHRDQIATPVAFCRACARAPEARVTPVQGVQTAPMFRQSKPSRYIPVDVRNLIGVRSGRRCEYIDPITRRRCESKSGLQLDHVVPFAKGGKSNAENLRHLCKAHNTLAAIEQFGSAKMRPFLKH